MGESTDLHNARLGISREEQDEFAARSQQRAAKAAKDGIPPGDVPVEIRVQEGTITFRHRARAYARTRRRVSRRLRPAFGANGTITAAPPRRSSTARRGRG